MEINREKFYQSKVWKHKREYILRRDNYLCQHCKWYGRRREASTVHHIKHLEDNPELAFENSNLISLCKDCHNKEHPEKRRQKKMIYIVCGYPGSGKTTYVKQHKKTEDIMLDLDILYKALTNNNEHSNKQKNIVAYINDLIKATLYKQEEYKFDIWLIRCMPDDIEIDILNRSDCKYIWVDTEIQECLRRLMIDKRIPKGFNSICERIEKQRNRYEDIFK